MSGNEVLNLQKVVTVNLRRLNMLVVSIAMYLQVLLSLRHLNNVNVA